MSLPQAPTGGRRSATTRRSRVNLTTILAVLLPLLCAGAILLVRPADAPSQAHPPTSTTLTSATLICPSSLPGDKQVDLSTVSTGVDAQVRLGLGGSASEVPLQTQKITSRDDGDALAVIGEDAAAPGLVASRGGGSTQAATTCRPPGPSEWFTGVGAGANHGSVLELTNPDSGTAVADIAVQGRRGLVDAPRLRGVSVPGGKSVRIDLSRTVPLTGDLALDVVTARGRIGATLLDKVDKVGSSPLTQDWMAPQADPATTNLMLGLAPGRGERSLVVSNPSADEARATLKIVSESSEFAPEGLDEIRVPPQSVVRVPVNAAVDKAVRDGGVGLALTSSVPVTATLRSITGGDISHAVPGEAFSDTAAILLPEVATQGGQAAKRTVVLAGATSAGTATVVALDADGNQLRKREVDVVPGRAVMVPVPAGTRQLSVQPSRTALHGAVVTSASGGTSVLPLTVPVTEGLVPDVRPGLS